MVLQKLREVEKLWDELLDIVWVVHERLPCRWDGMELTVGAVKPAMRRHGGVNRQSRNIKGIGRNEPSSPSALQLDVQGGEGLYSDHVVHHSGCVRVVRAIMKSVNCSRWVLKTFIPEGLPHNERFKCTAVSFRGVTSGGKKTSTSLGLL